MTMVGASPGSAGYRRSRLTGTAFLSLLALYTMLPLGYLLIASTKTQTDLFGTFGFAFGHRFALLGNIRDVFRFDGGIFARWLANTALYSGVAAIGATILCSAGGYAFARYRFRGRSLLFAIVLGAVMIPQTALTIPIFLLLSKIGLVDTPFAVILPSLVFPLGVYLMRVYVEQAVPQDLLDAARLDGAGEFRVFATIAFPLMTPAAVTVLLLSFVATWNNYFLPLVVLSTPSLFPATVGLASWYQAASAGGGSQAIFPLVMTGSLLAVVPVLLAFVGLQRFWQGGLAAGGVK
ncbi:carbohydrate ABC transporter permease [Lichenicoccus sp.]|uniref:carbohydrate ABC transporter permease n=1 Tax=Lichenicoccus sp. TaxID=2781899 RepID=UPI003D0E6A32